MPPFRCLYCANPDTIDVKGGTPTTPEEILQMAISQKAFFGKKGGITFSGGEPTLQAEALIPLFKELKANDIHICLDSNGTDILAGKRRAGDPARRMFPYFRRSVHLSYYILSWNEPRNAGRCHGTS